MSCRPSPAVSCRLSLRSSCRVIRGFIVSCRSRWWSFGPTGARQPRWRGTCALCFVVVSERGWVGLGYLPRYLATDSSLSTTTVAGRPWQWVVGVVIPAPSMVGAGERPWLSAVVGSSGGRRWVVVGDGGGRRWWAMVVDNGRWWWWLKKELVTWQSATTNRIWQASAREPRDVLNRPSISYL